jgi:hypothetical protein
VPNRVKVINRQYLLDSVISLRDWLRSCCDSPGMSKDEMVVALRVSNTMLDALLYGLSATSSSSSPKYVLQDCGRAYIEAVDMIRHYRRVLTALSADGQDDGV